MTPKLIQIGFRRLGRKATDMQFARGIDLARGTSDHAISGFPKGPNALAPRGKLNNEFHHSKALEAAGRMGGVRHVRSMRRVGNVLRNDNAVGPIANAEAHQVFADRR
jgi:hypothetical protein